MLNFTGHTLQNNDENMANEKALQLSNIDGSSDGATPNRYSIEKDLTRNCMITVDMWMWI
jgi:hypothetical protein